MQTHDGNELPQAKLSLVIRLDFKLALTFVTRFGSLGLRPTSILLEHLDLIERHAIFKYLVKPDRIDNV